MLLIGKAVMWKSGFKRAWALLILRPNLGYTPAPIGVQPRL